MSERTSQKIHLQVNTQDDLDADVIHYVSMHMESVSLNRVGEMFVADARRVLQKALGEDGKAHVYRDSASSRKSDPMISQTINIGALMRLRNIKLTDQWRPVNEDESLTCDSDGVFRNADGHKEAGTYGF